MIGSLCLVVVDVLAYDKGKGLQRDIDAARGSVAVLVQRVDAEGHVDRFARGGEFQLEGAKTELPRVVLVARVEDLDAVEVGVRRHHHTVADIDIQYGHGVTVVDDGNGPGHLDPVLIENRDVVDAQVDRRILGQVEVVIGRVDENFRIEQGSRIVRLSVDDREGGTAHRVVGIELEQLIVVRVLNGVRDEV